MTPDVFNPILVGIVVGLPTTAFGFFAYRRAERLDQEALRSAAIAVQGDAVQRVIDGLDRMVENLQVDNKEARELSRDLARRLKECNEAYCKLKQLTGG